MGHGPPPSALRLHRRARPLPGRPRRRGGGLRGHRAGAHRRDPARGCHGHGLPAQRGARGPRPGPGAGERRADDGLAGLLAAARGRVVLRPRGTRRHRRRRPPDRRRLHPPGQRLGGGREPGLGPGRARLAAQRGQGLDGEPWPQGQRPDPLLPRDRHRHRARHAEGRPRRLDLHDELRPPRRRAGRRAAGLLRLLHQGHVGRHGRHARRRPPRRARRRRPGPRRPRRPARARPPSGAPLPARRAPRGAPGPQAAPAVERAWTTVRPPERPLTPC